MKESWRSLSASGNRPPPCHAGKKLCFPRTQGKDRPEALLKMIGVHELAHLKEKERNKAFYQLCEHLLRDYHQLEIEIRLYLT